MKQYYVLVGNFGSGKTELALNLAVKSAQSGPCTLVDLDVVNPYFRATERGDVLEAAGVQLIAPPYAMHKIEIMSLSAEVYSAFIPGDGTVIFDAGGDPVGATALGQYKPNFEAIPPDRLHVLFVVNPNRPLAGDAAKAIGLMRNIEGTSRLRVTGLINNANLSTETSPEDLLLGYQVVREIAGQTGLPVAATCGAKRCLDAFWAQANQQGLDSNYLGEPWSIDILMHRDWERFVREGL